MLLFMLKKNMYDAPEVFFNGSVYHFFVTNGFKTYHPQWGPEPTWGAQFL